MNRKVKYIKVYFKLFNQISKYFKCLVYSISIHARRCKSCLGLQVKTPTGIRTHGILICNYLKRLYLDQLLIEIWIRMFWNIRRPEMSVESFKSLSISQFKFLRSEKQNKTIFYLKQNNPNSLIFYKYFSFFRKHDHNLKSLYVEKLKLIFRKK